MLDGYNFDSNYERTVRAGGLMVVRIDDEGLAAPYQSEIVLNQNVEASEEPYRDLSAGTRLLLGCRYALLRREFRKALPREDVNERIRKALVTFGGSDPAGLGVRVAEEILKASPDVEVTLLSGPTKLQTRLIDSPRIRHLQNSNSMPELMREHDLAFSAGGVTSLELARMGIPMSLAAVAANQNSNVNGLVRRVLARLLDAQNLQGSVRAALNEFGPPGVRRDIAVRGPTLVDGLGCFRLWLHLREGAVRFRKAAAADLQRTFEWSNDEAVRRASFQSEPIPLWAHEKWFTQILANPNASLWIAEDSEGRAIGQVRFEMKQTETFISISLDKAHRGNSQGTLLIWAACRKYFREGAAGVSRIVAQIKVENGASLKAFQKAGFVAKEQREINGVAAQVLEIAEHDLP
jgi:UDP-2,4-diacetamido-2,4,6-trideoxy-beta-L-altropyranose hydrolase